MSPNYIDDLLGPPPFANELVPVVLVVECPRSHWFSTWDCFLLYALDDIVFYK